MSAAEVPNAGRDAAVGKVDMHLEIDVIPVSDVDRAKEFYTRLGWRLDDDVAPLPGLRIVQFTPPGSPASITFGQGLTTAAARLGRGRADRLRHRSGPRGSRRPRHRRERHLARPAVPGRGPAARPGPRPRQLRVVLLHRRPGRQYLASPGGHDAAPRPDRRRGHVLHVHGRPGGRASAGRGRPPRAREARGAVAPLPPVRRGRGLARLVRRPHGGRAVRDRPAGVTQWGLARGCPVQRPGQRGHRQRVLAKQRGAIREERE